MAEIIDGKKISQEIKDECRETVEKEGLKKSLAVHDVTVQMIADAANVNISTVYRWLANPEKMNVGIVELIKNLTSMDREEFTRIFYAHEVA